MAGLNYFNETNRVITQGKTVYKNHELVFGSWLGTTVVASGASITYDRMWKSTRLCNMSYKYVGMNYQTALSCKDAMINLFTRSTQISFWDEVGGDMGDWVTTDGGNILMANIKMQGECGLYEVTVDVNEHDERFRKDNLPEGWLIEDQRTYLI